MKKSKVKLVVVLLGTPLFLMFQVLLISASTLEDSFQINYIKQDDEEVYEILGLNSYRKQRTASEKFNNLLEQFPIDSDKLKKSEEIYISVYKDNQYAEAVDGVAGGGYVVDQVRPYDDSEGFLSKVLIVYNYGYINSWERDFEAVSYVNFNKKFVFRNTDILVIWGGIQSIIDFNEEHAGTFKYDCTLTTDNYSSNYEETLEAELDYGYFIRGGIPYYVKLPEDFTCFSPDLDPKFISLTTSNWYFEGNYHFIQAGSVHVNSAYIHNESLLGGDLSMSIGVLGVSITTGFLGGYTMYSGKGITIDV